MAAVGVVVPLTAVFADAPKHLAEAKLAVAYTVSSPAEMWPPNVM